MLDGRDPYMMHAYFRTRHWEQFLNAIQSACPNGQFLLGDAAYPLLNKLLTPFKDNGRLTREQTYYNYCHSATRMCIERAFGLLKGRFRRLKMIDVESVERATKLIAAACILHNISLLSEESVANEVFIREGDEEEVNDFVSIQFVSSGAKHKRDSIMNGLCQQL